MVPTTTLLVDSLLSLVITCIAAAVARRQPLFTLWLVAVDIGTAPATPNSRCEKIDPRTAPAALIGSACDCERTLIVFRAAVGRNPLLMPRTRLPKLESTTPSAVHD